MSFAAQNRTYTAPIIDAIKVAQSKGENIEYRLVHTGSRATERAGAHCEGLPAARRWAAQFLPRRPAMMRCDSMKPGKILSRHPGQALDWLVKESSHSRVPSGTATGQALRFPQSVGRMARPLHEGGRHAARCTHPDTRLPPPQSRS